MITATYDIDGREFSLEVDGEVISGEDLVLGEVDNDIMRSSPWSGEGYCVQRFLEPEQYQEIRRSLARLILGFLVPAGEDSALQLEDYHRHCLTDESHHGVLAKLRHGLPLDRFPVDYRLLDQRMSEICGTAVTCAHPAQLAANRFCLRIVRPGRRGDNNPPHRDVWLDRLRQAVNIYVPLAGSNAMSSLSLIPRSHGWPESDICRTSDGARVDGVSYSVPSVVSSIHGLHMTRPPVGENEVLVFSPYLVHGGAANLNADVTRVSIEMRFWRV